MRTAVPLHSEGRIFMEGCLQGVLERESCRGRSEGLWGFECAQQIRPRPSERPLQHQH